MLSKVLIVLVALTAVNAINDRPIIGILSQARSYSDQEGETYIAASYIKFMESAGARVVPILTFQDSQYYDNIMDSVNGIIFPGGANSIQNDSGYGMAGQMIYEKILEKNAQGITFPLWATCLGFEMLGYLASQFTSFLVNCEASNIALPLILYPGYEESVTFSNMPEYIENIFVTQAVTAHFHKYCYEVGDFYDEGFGDDYSILATDFDENGLEFVSMVEHKSLPIFGTQFHPEKNAYEWKNDDSHDAIPHTQDSVTASQYMADMLVQYARQNNQTFATEEEEESMLIYQYVPTYVGDTSSSFVQIYVFE